MIERNLYPLEPLFGRIISPFERFLRRTTAGGIILIGVSLLTLIAACIIGDAAWHHFWEQPLSLLFGTGFRFDVSLHHFVNDGLMAFFFLLVGLELKREILVGELSSLRDAALPVVAAIGGMLVPSLIFLAFNHGTPTAHGWGIPMATDIAFAIGILVLLAWRIPRSLIVFLAALAIADDLGSVAVIACFYTKSLDLFMLGRAALVVAVLLLFNRGGVRRPLPYALLGLLLWWYLLHSGVHATLAGILLAFAIPARASHSALSFDTRLKTLHEAFHAETSPDTPNNPLSNHRMATIAENVGLAAITVQSPLQRIEHNLAPWVTFLIIPIFALANAGIDLTQLDWGATLKHPLTQGIVAGLVGGKFIGIGAFSWLAVKLGWGRLPTGVGWKQLLGAAWLGGIGFTMSLFVAQLAFNDALMMEYAKVGILLASLIAALLGLAWLLVASRPPRTKPAE